MIRALALVRSYCTRRRFSAQHEWVRRESPDGDEAVVGVSQFAQEALGEVVFAQLPDRGARLERGEECGALESVKAASELYSPVSGEVLLSNPKVVASPSLINSSCYDDGWLFRLKLSAPLQLDELMTEEQYAAFLRESRD